MSRDAKVFIGNVPTDCRESDIESFFRDLGEITEVVVKKNYAFCSFSDHFDAKDAVKERDWGEVVGKQSESGVCHGRENSWRGKES